MDRERLIIGKLKAQGLLPLFYHNNPQVCLDLTAALYEAGIRVIEFTHRGPDALENFKALVNHRTHNWPGLLLGIGTIKTGADASRFIDAGADLLVSPIFDAEISDVAYMQKIPWIPGCMTPSEIQVACGAGCNMIKLFPGQVLGPAFIEAIKPIFPQTDFMVTGGVQSSSESINSWLKAGAAVLGMGSRLISPERISERNYSAISQATAEVLAIISHYRK